MTEVTFIEEPNLADAGHPVERYDDFANALRGHLAAANRDLRAIKGQLHDVVPRTGLVLLCSVDHFEVALSKCEESQRTEIASRLVPIGISGARKKNLVTIERLSLAAATDGLSLLEWSASRGQENGAWGLYGLRHIGETIGAECFMQETERYCFMNSPSHHSLPHLLAAYLVTLGERAKPGTNV